MKKLLIGLGMAAALLLNGCGSSYVQQGHVGLLVSNMSGQIDKVLDPGYRMAVPIGQHIVVFPIMQQQYVMVQAGSEGQVRGDDSVKVNSLEGQTFMVDASVEYHIRSKADVPGLYQKYGMDFEDIVSQRYRSKFRTAINNAFSALPMADAITRAGKLSVEKQALQDLQTTLGADNIEVTEVMVRAVHVPDAIADSISLKTKAENDLVRARTTAQQQVVEAQAQAQARIIRAEAEAKANNLVSSSLTDKLLRKTYIEKLAPNVQLFMPEKALLNLGGVVPTAGKEEAAK